MNNPLLKMAGLATLTLCLHTSGRAQDATTTTPDEDTTTPAKTHSMD